MQTDLPKKIKYESVSNEDKITKELYKDYSAFRKELFTDIVQLNPQYNQLELFKKTQKLLDRFLFIFFAEDRQLLPTNLIFSINLEWQKLREARIPISLYDRYKMYFNDLNTGARVSLPAFGKHTNEIVTAQYDIYAYNGGLFQPDDLLDNIAINDDLLFKHTKKLSEYDFESEVDVNILGHIFENSLNEIDEITNAIEGQEVDKTKTKRKKDGVFYTPKYITKYIVDNTIGKLFEEKKIEIELDETKYSTDKKINVTTKKKLKETLDSYRNWLLQLTIVDPACGSGAFLNQSLEFLIAEHKYVDELQAKLFGDALVLSDVEGSILENNLFGVDINEESVEIAKLSLWLRTAQRNRKLNSLNNNIKCGNSLIDDVAIAGDKAFNWQNEFPKVFANGGFDVVIGNPPYVNANDIKKNSTPGEYNYLKTNYKIAKGTVDLYLFFFEKGLNILKKNGLLAYITPNRFLSASYGKAFREILLTDYKLLALIDYSDKIVFADASTYPVITFIKNELPEIKYEVVTGKFDEDTKNLISNYYPSDKLNILDDSILGFLLNDKIKLTLKVFSKSESLENCGKISATSTASEADLYSELISEKSGYKLINTGTIDPYFSFWGLSNLTDKGKKYLFPYLPKDSSIISKNRHNLYNSKKIIISKIGLQCEAFYDKSSEFASINTNCIYNFSKSYLPEYVLCWLNSKLYNFTFECLFDGLRMSGGYLLFSAPNLKNTKIKKISIFGQQPFIEKADLMLQKNKELQEVSSKFTKYFSGQFKIEKLSSKLEKWYGLSFEEFMKEINKVIKAQKGTPLSKKDEFDWIDLFEENKAKANKLQSDISFTDKAIDAMVYELYGLSNKEIGIIENS